MLTEDQIINLAKQAGMNAVKGHTFDKKFYPAVSAIGHTIPLSWLMKFANLVKNEKEVICN